MGNNQKTSYRIIFSLLYSHHAPQVSAHFCCAEHGGRLMESQRGFLDIVPHPKALSALAPHPLSLVCRVSCVGAEVVISGEERRGEEKREGEQMGRESPVSE